MTWYPFQIWERGILKSRMVCQRKVRVELLYLYIRAQKCTYPKQKLPIRHFYQDVPYQVITFRKHRAFLRDQFYKLGVPSWICKKKTCRTTHSIRASTRCSHMKQGNPKLTLSKIVSLIYVFILIRSTILQVSQKKGQLLSTACDCFNLCHKGSNDAHSTKSCEYCG